MPRNRLSKPVSASRHGPGHRFLAVYLLTFLFTASPSAAEETWQLSSGAGFDLEYRPDPASRLGIRSRFDDPNAEQGFQDERHDTFDLFYQLRF
jgi:hypothetical protein